MTAEQLQALIESDEQALTLARSGSDDLCAIRCREIAPKALRQTMITELSVLNLFDNPADAEAVLQQIEQVSEANPVIARILKWLQPGAPGIDIGDTRSRMMLTLPINQGGIGLTEQQAESLLRAAETEPQISGVDVANLGIFEGK